MCDSDVPVVYEKYDFDRGTPPEVGMTVNFGGDDVVITRLSFNPAGKLEIITPSGWGYTNELKFPEPKTLEEDTVAAMVERWDNMGTDHLSTESIMQKLYTVVLKTAEEFKDE